MAKNHGPTGEEDEAVERRLDESPRPECICRDREVVYANEAMVDLLAAGTRPDLHRREVAEVADELAGPAPVEEGADAPGGGGPEAHDEQGTRVYPTTGDVGHIEASCRRIEYGGEPGLHLICHEVGAGDDAEGRAPADDRFRAIFGACDHAMLVVDPETDTVREANQRAAELVGYARQELLTSVTPAADFAVEGSDAWRRCVETGREGEKATAEFTLQTGAGDRKRVELSTAPVAFGEGEHVLVTLRDVTDRKRREESLADLRARTRELIQADDRQTVASTVVDTVRSVLGFPISGVWLHDESADVLRPSAVSEDRVDLFGDPAAHGPGSGVLWEAFESGEELRNGGVCGRQGAEQVDPPTSSGFVLPLGAYGVLVVESLESGAFDEIDVALARILATNAETALERADREEQLRVNRRRLRRQNDRLTEFTSMVAHDLRNPLNVARAQLALAREQDDPAYLADVEQALGRMGEIIDDVLTMIRQGGRVEETESVALSTIGERAWKNVTTGEASLRIDDDPTVQADPARVQHIFENLFRNAVEHAGPGVTVTVGALDDGFFVADDGPGIPSADRDRIFESDYSTAEDGTGFGLKIVHEMATAHGWNVTVTESEQGGARFEFTGVTG